MDLSSISTILSSLKTATEIAKFIKDSDVTIEKAESKLKFAELISALADAKIEVAEIQQLLLEKDDEIKQLKSDLDVKSKLIWEKPNYWIVDGINKEGPFCQRCYDKDRKLIRLQEIDEGCWDCKVCDSRYLDGDYDDTLTVYKT